MLAWLSRLVGLAPEGPALRKGRAGVQAKSAAAAGATGATAAGGAAAAAEQPLPQLPPQFGLRRPLLGRGGAVAGFELLLPPAIQRRLDDNPGDTAMEAAHRVALLASAAPLTAAGRSSLIRMPAAVLERAAVCEAVPTGALLMVDKLADLRPNTAAALRQRGVGLGAPDGPPSRDVAVDFVVLQASAGGLDTLLLSAQRWREVWPRLTVIALGLDTLDDLERALRSGINMAGGQFGRGTAPLAKRELGAAAHRICELLNHLAMDRDTAEIGATVRADVTLAYRLLRYANSPAIGLRRAVDSVDDAVTVLGRNELYRWLTVLLMQSAQSRQASKALQESALARGRLFENLSAHSGIGLPGALFTVGLLSMMDMLLQIPMEAALRPLRLADEARAALLERSGPWAPFLDLADALEAGNAPAMEANAAAFGGLDEVLPVAEAAWAWAALAGSAST